MINFGVYLASELVYKPDSVFVRRFIYAANPEARRVESAPPYLALLPAGFAKPSQLPKMLVRSYRTFSPSPRQTEAVYFLLHFPSLANQIPSFPKAPYPAESGLSSLAGARAVARLARIVLCTLARVERLLLTLATFQIATRKPK